MFCLNRLTVLTPRGSLLRKGASSIGAAETLRVPTGTDSNCASWSSQRQ